jgi:hypothetical protein
MAINKAMNLMAVATVLLLVVSMEVGNVRADYCDQQGILNKLTACLSVASGADPTPGSSCCNAMSDVQNNIKPSSQCICLIAKSQLMATVGLNVDKIKLIISTCVGANLVPACL